MTDLNPNLNCVVSVIVPLYNAAATITATLDSIVATETSGLEIIIVDDGSKDEGWDAVVSFQQSHPYTKIVLERHSGNANLGASKTRNYAATLATGRYLAFLDADDLYHAHRFTDSIAMLDADPELAAVFGTFKYLVDGESTDGQVREISKELDWDDSDFPTEQEMPFLTQQLNGKSGLHTSTVTLRRDVFRELGGFPNLKYVDDQALWLRLFATEHAARVTGPHLSLYRIHNNSWCSGGEQSLEFLFGPVLSRMNAIAWLKSNHPNCDGIHEIRQNLPGKLFHRYFSVADKDKSARLFMFRLMLKSAKLHPAILTDRRFWSILIRLFIRRRVTVSESSNPSA